MMPMPTSLDTLRRRLTGGAPDAPDSASIGALKKVTSVNGVTIDPDTIDPFDYAQLLGQQRDRRVAEMRASEDAGPLDASTQYMRTFTRGQEDAAMGPSGYNRQWVPFFEAQRAIQDANPDKTFRANYSGLTPRIAADASDGPEGPYGKFGSGPATEGPYGKFATRKGK